MNGKMIVVISIRMVNPAIFWSPTNDFIVHIGNECTLKRQPVKVSSDVVSSITLNTSDDCTFPKIRKVKEIPSAFTTKNYL